LPVKKENDVSVPSVGFDLASARPASKLDQVAFNVMDNNSFAMEKAKDLISGFEALPSVVGKAVYLTGESMKIYANKETRGISPFLPFQRPKNVLENSPVAKAYDKMIGQFGSQLSVIGKTFSDFFENAANKGFESPNPAVMAGWKYPIRKVTSLAVRGLPMLGAAAAVTAVTKNPIAGASTFFPISATDYYDDAIAHGLPPEQAMGGAMALGTSQTLLESIPMANWMKGGSIAKRVFSTAISEGLVEEGSQQLIDNGLRVLGWDDGRPVYDRMVDGLAESVLAGTLMGGTLGMFQAPGVEEVRKDVEDFVIKEGFKKGLTDEQIVKSVEVAHNAIETAITAPKQEVVAEPTQEVATIETKVSEPKSPLHIEEDAKNNPLTRKVRGLSNSVATRAIEEKLNLLSDELPEYDVKTNKEQASWAQSLVENDFGKALQIAMGEEQAPEGLLNGAVYTAVVNHAIATKNGTLVSSLAFSDVTGQATRYGQEIQILSQLDPESPVSAIKDVALARENMAKARNKVKSVKKLKKETVAKIKADMKGSAVKAETWADFVNGIKC